jgi:hypothetical protein
MAAEGLLIHHAVVDLIQHIKPSMADTPGNPDLHRAHLKPWISWILTLVTSAGLAPKDPNSIKEVKRDYTISLRFT